MGKISKHSLLLNSVQWQYFQLRKETNKQSKTCFDKRALTEKKRPGKKAMASLLLTTFTISFLNCFSPQAKHI